MPLLQFFKSKGPSGFGFGSTAEQVTEGLDLAGKTFLVTGVNSGLGQETLRVLSLRGAKVLGTARTAEKAKAACQAASASAVGFACELSDPHSVAACVAEVKKTGLKLDGIVANAGIMALPTRELSFGYERQFFTNHIGHFALVTGLLDRLAEDGRVVMLSSGAHSMAPAGGIEFDNLAADRDYSPWKQYGQSKFANLLFAKELARLFQGTKKTANAVHPGVIRTNLSRHMNPVARVVFAAVGPLFLKSVAQGAATQVWAATHPSLASTSGQYFADCNIARAREDSDNEATAKKLFEVSERIVAEVK